jgi:hypothetical protein
MIVSDLLLFCVEADTLSDDRRLRARGAPNWIRHFKSNGKDALACLPCTVSECMPTTSESSSELGLIHESYLPASLLADVVPSCSGGTYRPMSRYY